MLDRRNERRVYLNFLIAFRDHDQLILIDKIPN